MNLKLILIFSAIFVVSAILIFSLFRRPKRKKNSNRYSKRLSHVEPSFGEKPEETEEESGYDEIEESDFEFIETATPTQAKRPHSHEPIPSQIFALHLMASKDQAYNGYELLQALLSAGLRYGKMQIFHRHEQKTGRGEILFSLASATSPGTFELPKMGAFTCQGLVLFFDSAKTPDPKKAYEIMLETAEQLAEDLGGEILDERRVPLSDEKISETLESLEYYTEQV